MPLWDLLSGSFYDTPDFHRQERLAGDLFAHGDGSIYYYPLGAYWRDVFRSGFIDWNSYNFLGYSLAGSMQAGTYYPMNLIYLWMGSGLAFDWGIILHYALAAQFMYLFCSTQVARRSAAILGGAAFAFAGFLMAHRGHVAMMNTGVWLPLILYCYERFRLSLKWSWLFGGAIVFAVQVTAGYFAVVVYTCILLFLYAVLTEIFNRENAAKTRRIGLAAVAAISQVGLGCLLAAPQFYNTLVSFRGAWRGNFDYYFFVAGSYPPFELISLVFPFLFGGGYGLPLLSPTDVVEEGGFLGSLALVTAIVTAVALWKRLSKVRVWTTIALLVTIVMFNRYTPAAKLLFWVPVLHIFRFQSRFIIGLDLAIAMLFCLGLEHILLNRETLRLHFRKFALVGAAFIGIALFISTLSAALFSQHIFDEPGLAQYLTPSGISFVQKGLSLASPTLYVPILFLLGLVALVWWIPKMASERWQVACLLLFLFAEQYSFSLYYDTNWPQRAQMAFGSSAFDAARDPAITFTERLLGDSRYFETGVMPYLTGAPLPNGNLNLPERRASLNGIEPLISEDVNRMFGFFPNGVSPFADRLASGNLFLSLSAVKFLIAPSNWYRRPVLDRAVETTAESILPRLETVNPGVWQLNQATQPASGDFILAPRPIEEISVGGMVYANVRLERGARYLICLDARVEETKNPLAPGSAAALIADFYTPGFETEQSKLRLYSVDIDESFKSFESIFETELSDPPVVQLRIFNTSGYRIRVRGITVRKQHSSKLPVSKAAAERIAANGGRPYKLLFDHQGYAVYENLNALPRVFCSEHAIGVDSRSAIRQMLLAWQVNPANDVLFTSSDLASIAGSLQASLACGTLNVSRFKPGVVDIEISFTKPGVVVFSEAWDPRWHAYLDGIETPDFRVDYFAQGAVVQPGTRKLQFRYRPFRSNYGLAGPPLFALLWIFAFWRSRMV